MGHLDRIALAKMTGKSVVKFVALLVVACTLLSGQKQFVEAAESDTPSTSSRTGVSNTENTNDLVSLPEKEFKHFLDICDTEEETAKQIVMAKKVYYDNLEYLIKFLIKKLNNDESTETAEHIVRANQSRSRSERALFFIKFLETKLYKDDEQAKEKDYAKMMTKFYNNLKEYKIYEEKTLTTEQAKEEDYAEEEEEEEEEKEEEKTLTTEQAKEEDYAKMMTKFFGEFGKGNQALLKAFDKAAAAASTLFDASVRAEVAPAVTTSAKKLKVKQRQRRARRQRQRPSNGIKQKKRGKAKILGHILQKHGKSKKPTS